MEPQHSSFLLDRLERLERTNRLNQRLGAAALILIGLLLTAYTLPSPQVQQVVTARKFVLVDDQGHEVATLASVYAGGGTLRLRTKHDQREVLLGVGPGGPGLELKGEGTFAALWMNPRDGSPSLVMRVPLYEREAMLLVDDQSPGGAVLRLDGGPLAGSTSLRVSHLRSPTFELGPLPGRLGALEMSTDTTGTLILTQGMRSRRLPLGPGR